MREPLSPRDALHLAALRGAIARVDYLAARGKRRDEHCMSVMEGSYMVARISNVLTKEELEPFLESVKLVHLRGYREVLTQLHVLEGRK